MDDVVDSNQYYDNLNLGENHKTKLNEAFLSCDGDGASSGSVSEVAAQDV